METAEKNNMRIWWQVCTTPPEHTKQVKMRGGFTSIDAQYTIQKATEVFGAVGDGWGYNVEYQFQDGLVFALVTIWHGTRENYYGPICGCNNLRNGQGIDEDAPKKAFTDALTKGLSHLGFSADVFLGLYDNQKYVNDLKAQSAAQQKAQPATAPAPQPPLQSRAAIVYSPGLMLLGKNAGKPIKEMDAAIIRETVIGATPMLTQGYKFKGQELTDNEKKAVSMWINDMRNWQTEMGEI